MKVVLDPLVALEELDGVHDNQALPAGIPAAPRRAMDAVVPMGLCTGRSVAGAHAGEPADGNY
jgi:hypothetical protein